MAFDFNSFGNNKDINAGLEKKKSGFDFNSFGQSTKQTSNTSFKYQLSKKDEQQQKIDRLKSEAANAEEEAKKAASFKEQTLRPLADTFLPGVMSLSDTIGGILGEQATADDYAKTSSDLTDQNIQLIKKIRELDKSGKDSSTLKKLYNQNIDTLDNLRETKSKITKGMDKTTFQLAGELGMTGLNILTAGTFGKLAGMKTGQLATKAPSVVSNIAKVVEQPAKFFSKNTALKVGEGAAIGEAFDITQNLQEGKTGTDVLTEGYGKYIGAGIPAVARAGSATLNELRQLTPEIAKSKFVQNINNIFKQSPQTIKKLSDYADERGVNLGQEIADRGFMPVVENDRLKFGTKPFEALDDEIAEKSGIIDLVIAQYPDTQVTAPELKQRVAQQIKSSPVLVREGRVIDITKEAEGIIDDFVAQTGRDTFSLQEIQNFKKGMWGASKKFRLTEVGKSDAYSEVGTTFRKLIEDEIPDVNIKKINEDIGKAQELYTVLDKINSLQDGGIVLKGGKIGKYVTDIIGTLGGGVLGNVVAPGPVGIAIGGVTGQKLTTLLRGLSQKSSVLGAIDRILMKFAKKVPENASVVDAKKFIEQVKGGKKPTVTPRVQQAVEDALEAEYYAELKASMDAERQLINAKLNAGEEAYKNATPAIFNPSKTQPEKAFAPIGSSEKPIILPYNRQSSVTSGRADKTLPQRDPKTGQMKTVYTQETVEQGKQRRKDVIERALKRGVTK